MHTSLFGFMRSAALRTVLTPVLLFSTLGQPVMVAAPPPPAWWATQQVLDPLKPQDDYTVANIGQLKAIAKKASLELRDSLGSEGTEIATMIQAWDAPAATGAVRDDYVAVNAGMLKNVVSKYYDRLRIARNNPELYSYPWPIIKKTGGTLTSGSTALVLPDTFGIAKGQRVFAPGLPAEAAVAGLIGTTQILLSHAPSASASGAACLFLQPGAGRRLSVSAAAASDVLTLASTAGLVPGMSVFGPGLPDGIQILEITDGTHLRISAAVTTVVTNSDCLFALINDYALVNLGQLKNVFSFRTASFADPVPLAFPTTQSANPAYFAAKGRWDLAQPKPEFSSATDFDGDGIPNNQEYWMSLLPGGPPATYYEAGDLDGDRIPNSVEDEWNGSAPPATDTVPVLNSRRFADAADDFWRYSQGAVGHIPSDGVMNYEEIKLGLSPANPSTTTLPGQARIDLLTDTQVLAWGLLHGSSSLSPSVDAIEDCWEKLIALSAVERATWFETNGIVTQPAWLVTSDGTDVGTSPDGLDAFRAEAPSLLALQLTLPTSSTEEDRDDDGMSDIWEYRYGLDPRSAADKDLDPDNDGLTNSQEFNSGIIGNSGGSNPFLVDTDGDGYTDKGEKAAGANATTFTAPNQMPLKMVTITSTLPSRFIGMPTDAMIVQVHKGGIPQPAVPITFDVTNSVPSSWGLMASAPGGVSTTGSLIVRTDSNGLASVTFTGAKTGKVQIRATSPSGITPSPQFFNFTIEAIPSYMSSISGNYVNDGGGADGSMFSQARNSDEAESQLNPTSEANDFGLRIQKGYALNESYKNKEKVPFNNGGKVAQDQYPLSGNESGWKYLEHSLITFKPPPVRSDPLSSSKSQAKQRTFLIVQYDSDTNLKPNAATWDGKGPTPSGITAEVKGTITFEVDENGKAKGTKSKAFTPGNAGEGNAFSIHLFPVEFNLRASPGMRFHPQSENEAREELVKGLGKNYDLTTEIDALGVLPIGLGRREAFLNAYCAPVEVYATAPQVPGISWKWKRTVKSTYWHILFGREVGSDGPGTGPHVWKVIQKGTRESVDDPFDEHQDTIPSSSGRIYTGDNSGVNLFLQAVKLSNGDYYYEERQFVYSLEVTHSGTQFSLGNFKVAQIMGLKRIAQAAPVNMLAPDFQGEFNVNWVGEVDRQVTESEVRALVKNNIPIRLP